MKVRIPFELTGRTYRVSREQALFNTKIDDILLWAMETGLDAEYYSMYTVREKEPRPKNTWGDGEIIEAGAVLTIEAKDMLMFALRWGAKFHKPQKEMI